MRSTAEASKSSKSSGYIPRILSMDFLQVVHGRGGGRWGGGQQQSFPGDSNVQPRLRMKVCSILGPDTPSSQEREMWAPKLKTQQGTGDKGILLPKCRARTTSNRTSKGPMHQVNTPLHTPNSAIRALESCFWQEGPSPSSQRCLGIQQKQPVEDSDAFCREFQTSHVQKR